MASTITGARVRAAGQAAPKPRSSRRVAADRRRVWAAERGAIAWEATADVLGGFPGFAELGGRLHAIRVRITDRYLIVDEGRPHGFGIPLRWLVGVHLVAPPDRLAAPLLRVAYGDGSITRWFTLRFRSAGLRRRHADHAPRALDTLRAAGVPGRLDAASVLPPAAPFLAVSWDEARRFEQENVIWSGQGSAPVAVGAEPAAVAVWLTTRSLIWSADAGSGVNRLPLVLVRDVFSAQLADRAATPVAYVAFAFASDAGDRHELPFRFDRHATADRNLRERGAFLVGLRSRGVPLGAPAPLLQPWHPDAFPDPVSQVPPPTAPLATEPAWPTIPVDAATPASIAPGPPDGDEDCVRFAATPPTAVFDAPQPDAPPETARPPTSLTQDLPLTRAYEAAALAALATVLRAIDDPTTEPPPPADPSPAPRQTAALTELDASTASGALAAADAATRRTRLLALADAAPRLRTLLELRAVGHLTDADLAAKRTAILAPLSRELFGADG